MKTEKTKKIITKIHLADFLITIWHTIIEVNVFCNRLQTARCSQQNQQSGGHGYFAEYILFLQNYNIKVKTQLPSLYD